MRFAFGLCGIVFLMNLAGCGSSDWGTATGIVTFDGQPLKKGLITFEPENGGASSYAQIKAGRFTAMTGASPGLKVGKYKVVIVAQTVPDFATGQQAELLTPPKYASVTTSDLSAAIQPGRNELSFAMTK